MKYWNEISEETTVYGYPLKELVLFAEACKAVSAFDINAILIEMPGDGYCSRGEPRENG